MQKNLKMKNNPWNQGKTKVMQQFTLLCELGISHERYLENIFIDIYWKYWNNM